MSSVLGFVFTLYKTFCLVDFKLLVVTLILLSVETVCDLKFSKVSALAYILSVCTDEYLLELLSIIVVLEVISFCRFEMSLVKSLEYSLALLTEKVGDKDNLLLDMRFVSCCTGSYKLCFTWEISIKFNFFSNASFSCKTFEAFILIKSKYFSG